MQLKIIRIRGQNCGRPLIRGSGRDGPGSSEFKVQSLKFEIFEPLVNLSVLSTSVVKRRWGESVGSWQLAIGSNESAVSSQQSAVRDLVRQLADGILNLFRILNFEFGIPHPGPYGFRSSLARDWIHYTCLVHPHIKRYRYKNRWEAKGEPAIGGGAGMLCINV